MLLHTVDWFYQ